MTGIPDPRTGDGRAEFIAFYRRLSIPELRRRQDLTSQQIRAAYAQRNTNALTTLQAIDALLGEAVYEKVFS